MKEHLRREVKRRCGPLHTLKPTHWTISCLVQISIKEAESTLIMFFMFLRPQMMKKRSSSLHKYASHLHRPPLHRQPPYRVFFTEPGNNSQGKQPRCVCPPQDQNTCLGGKCEWDGLEAFPDTGDWGGAESKGLRVNGNAQRLEAECFKDCRRGSYNGWASHLW